jgi:predicted metal-dependent phosphoesterase TrpH
VSAARRWAAIAVGVIVGTSLLAQPDLVPLVGDASRDTRLVLPTAYVALSPALRLLDALTLLSLGQHVALWVSVLLLWALWWRARRVRATGALVTLAGMTAVAVVVYAAASLLPRPMARLVTGDADVVRVDFHAHTSASHDVPRWFDVAARRAWHHDAGYDVAYVADHRDWSAVRLALASNPARAGDGVVLLSALEGYVGHLHVVFLGLTPADSALVVRQHLYSAVLTSGRAPVTIATIPGPLFETIDAAARDTPPFVRAIEIVDGAPKGLWQGDRDADALRDRARALGMARVAGSNHHGWGRTAVAWNLVRLPGWRTLGPDTLAARIADVVRSGAAGDIRVVARRRPSPGRSVLALGATLPVLVWQTLTTLQPTERIVWVAWIVALVLLARRRRLTA